MSVPILIIGFYGEGTTDYRFLSGVILRTVEEIVRRAGRGIFDISVEALNGEIHNLPTRTEQIVAAAQRAANYHLLVVHADADGSNPKKARIERINPGFDLIQAMPAGVCKQLVALIPVRMTESWMLADEQGLIEVIKSYVGLPPTQLPNSVKQPEKIDDPKHLLEEILQAVLSQRRRRSRWQLGELYSPLGEQISLPQLRRLPSFQMFEEAIIAALRSLQVID